MEASIDAPVHSVTLSDSEFQLGEDTFPFLLFRSHSRLHPSDDALELELKSIKREIAQLEAEFVLTDCPALSHSWLED